MGNWAAQIVTFEVAFLRVPWTLQNRAIRGTTISFRGARPPQAPLIRALIIMVYFVIIIIIIILLFESPFIFQVVTEVLITYLLFFGLPSSIKDPFIVFFELIVFLF